MADEPKKKRPRFLPPLGRMKKRDPNKPKGERINLDAELHNADWTKQTADFPLEKAKAAGKKIVTPDCLLADDVAKVQHDHVMPLFDQSDDATNDEDAQKESGATADELAAKDKDAPIETAEQATDVEQELESKPDGGKEMTKPKREWQPDDEYWSPADDATEEEYQKSREAWEHGDYNVEPKNQSLQPDSNQPSRERPPIDPLSE